MQECFSAYSGFAATSMYAGGAGVRLILDHRSGGGVVVGFRM